MTGMHTIVDDWYAYQSSTQNNNYEVSQKYSCFSWWWAQSRPKHVEIDKYTKNKFVQQVCFIHKNPVTL
jgi:hypothetical protein